MWGKSHFHVSLLRRHIKRDPKNCPACPRLYQDAYADNGVVLAHTQTPRRVITSAHVKGQSKQSARRWHRLGNKSQAPRAPPRGLHFICHLSSRRLDEQIDDEGSR
ncbi:hypothetical protein EVAR_62240_1 [Eumeta japonica]|uniref:Uncharacterized protein n=1 Tax=Eumeta variegata TaxID=151549 RepID=A0A4C1ZAR0_EUMVA|nr:hypothetical protein EVAR_62240_1 [Eumeta japonica]